MSGWLSHCGTRSFKTPRPAKMPSSSFVQSFAGDDRNAAPPFQVRPFDKRNDGVKSLVFGIAVKVKLRFGLKFAAFETAGGVGVDVVGAADDDVGKRRAAVNAVGADFRHHPKFRFPAGSGGLSCGQPADVLDQFLPAAFVVFTCHRQPLSVSECNSARRSSFCRPEPEFRHRRCPRNSRRGRLL